MSDFFLADDLSGALDAAAAFHGVGWRVTIALSPESWPRAGEGEMVGFTTETRNSSPSFASAAVARAIARGREGGGELVYKKIDSTLRGPVAAELAALTSAMPDARVLFTPANPAVGRTVREGVLLVQGVPVAETEFGRDPVNPVKESVVRELLGRAGSERVTIADAETEADLTAAVARMDAAGADWVGVGSGALARPIAARHAVPRRARTETPPHEPSAGPALMVCGSAHARNREQAAVLARTRGVLVQELRLGAPSAAAVAAIAEIRKNRSATLLIEEQRHDHSADVVQAIAAVANEVLKATGLRRVFVTGGETAFALCRLLGVATFTFGAEIEPGLSLSRAGHAGGSMWFAIKPGGFGDAHTWVRAWDALQLTPELDSAANEKPVG